MKVTNCLYCNSAKLKLVTHRSDDNGILRCDRCKVMMVENIADNTESLYTADYFEKDKDTKSGYTNYLSSPVANLIGKYAFGSLFVKPNGKHLDLGCADGSLMEIFLSEGFSTRGLEISKDAVAIANSKGLDVKFSRLYSFPDNIPTSNIITAYDLLEHADQPGRVLRNVYDNLEKDGCFVFSTLSVKKSDPSDYWFNNSLEHYVYYNQESLGFILTEVFGEGNFGFVEMEINGIAEFWGFAKKGEAKKELKIINQIDKRTYDKKDQDMGYLLSLFYNQVSEFDVSKEIITAFESSWSAQQLLQAKFYNNFYQGQLEIAVADAKANVTRVPANSVYWQALSSAEDTLFEIVKGDLETEIVNLRSELFKVRDELHTLKNSRVIGKIIKVRDRIGSPRTLPKKSINKARRTVARYVPDSVRLPLMRNLRKTRDGVKRRVGQYRDKPVKITVMDNTVREKNVPLVSVVIPYYNRADTIDETLESLEKQTFIDFEVIVVDDKSSDKESIKKLDKLKAAKIIRHKTNQGVAAARNSGIAAANGMYVICLDSDDVLEETFIEKSVIILETDPDVALVSTYQDAFGVVNELFVKHPYDPLRLLEDNMVITAAMFRRAAWEQTGGYKPDIGYEDWEFWLTLAENGYWGKQLPEPLFKYRTSMQSRYVEDKDVHWKNIKTIRNIHEGYKKRIRSLMAERRSEKHVVSAETALINMNDPKVYSRKIDDKPNVLIAMPWMTFGGAETLIYNLCRQTMDEYNISFVTGLASENEWEYKFREISHDIYHLPNLFEDKELYVEFLSNFIRTRKIEILHLIHTDFVFEMLPRLKKEFPNLKVVVTMFNDRVPNYVAGVVAQQKHIDIVTSDNQKTVASFKERLSDNANLKAIPNGIDGINEFSPALFDRKQEREKLKLHADDLAVFFVGRLSEEKNPDVFVDVAGRILDTHKNKKIKFYIIGDGPMRHDIEKQLNTIHSDGITYLGYQSEVARYLGAADVFVLPSAIEGFPLSILEAMAMKVVVIASRVGAIPDVIKHGHNGYIVEPGSVNEIEKIIIELESDRKKVEKIKRTEREILERTYSHTQLGRNYKNLYEEALS